MSLLTGPNRDHTTRNATGGYIIAQGFSAIFLSEFRFYSPSVDLTWSDDYCLRIGLFSFFNLTHTIWAIVFESFTLYDQLQLLVPDVWKRHNVA